MLLFISVWLGWFLFSMWMLILLGWGSVVFCLMVWVVVDMSSIVSIMFSLVCSCILKLSIMISSMYVYL